MSLPDHIINCVQMYDKSLIFKQKCADPEFCKFVISRGGDITLQYIPEKYQTLELCTLAVSRNSYALKYVPEKLKTAELCTLAVIQNGYALQHVPEELKTLDLCVLAVRQYKLGLLYVPEELKSTVLEICQKAFTQKNEYKIKN